MNFIDSFTFDFGIRLVKKDRMNKMEKTVVIVYILFFFSLSSSLKTR